MNPLNNLDRLLVAAGADDPVALIKEAGSGDEMAYRRLLFLDKTLEGMIRRFEDEYPECRLAAPSSPKVPASLSSSVGSVADSAAFSEGPPGFSSFRTAVMARLPGR